ncbi:MAG: CRISPR-associated protein Cas4 [Desulfobacteraceae bacterium]|jgi:CRISPR-associated exonuclease Cas4
MYTEDNLLPISALQHLLFCERQCALIHIERSWVDNLYTVEGSIMHERVDSGRVETRGNVRTCCSVPLRSLCLGIFGVADMVEFHKEKTTQDKRKIKTVIWRPYPVEYKRGRQKKEDWDRVQLCAQAVCLEEMLKLDVPEGSIFYGKARRRKKVPFTRELRNKTSDTAKRLHALIDSQKTPPPVVKPVCKNCSFVQECLPDVLTPQKSVENYLKEVIKAK